MRRRRRILHYFGYMVRIITAAMTVLILLTGCGKSEPTATPLPAVATRITLEPTYTPPPPTETPPPPTETPVPPTNTPLPPTATPVPPTETLLPPTETPVPMETPQPTPTLDPTVFQLRSPAFGLEETIPSRYTCKGEDISPPLEWGAPPSGTQSLVLIVDDISAGNLTHWLLFNIAPTTRSMSEAVPTQGHFEDGRQQGTNQILALGYFGPCPLPGPNRYRFRLYALDTMLDLEDGVMRIPLKEAMRGHILAETETIGMFP
jgi:hypothetical protein